MSTCRNCVLDAVEGVFVEVPQGADPKLCWQCQNEAVRDRERRRRVRAYQEWWRRERPDKVAETLHRERRELEL